MTRIFTPVAGETHHIVLSDGTTTMGFLSTDMMASFRRVPVARTSLKTSSGATLYSDMEEPYHTIMQDDFSGGRGLKDLRVDPSRFYDSNSVDTRFKGKIFLGPKVHRTTAQVGIPSHEPGTATDVSVPYAKVTQETYPKESMMDGDRKACQSFVAQLGTISSAAFYVKTYIDTPNTNVVVHIRSGYNGASLGSATVSVSTTGWQTATFASPISVTAGTTYWLCMEPTGGGFGIGYSNVDPYADGYRMVYDGDSWWDNSYQYDLAFRVYFSQYKRAMSFVYSGSGSYTVTHCYLYLKKSGTVTPTVRIETDSSGPSGTLANANATKTLTDAQVDNSYGWVRVEFSSFSLTKGTTYWIVVYDGTQREAPANMLYWAGDAALGSSGSAMYKVGSAAWAADSTYDFYFRINSGEGFTNKVFKMFEYRGAFYAVDAPEEGTDASSMWLNGDRGVADSNKDAKITLVDGTKSWTTNEWAGCVVKIIAGAGYGEYRTIVSNTATALTVDTDWTLTHDTTTEYVIVGSDKWTNVTPSKMTKPVKDIIGFYGFLFYCFGDALDSVVYQAYNSGSAYATREDDSLGGYTSKFWLFSRYTDRLYGAAVRGASPEDGTWIYYCEHEDWGVDLDITVNKRVEIGEATHNITGLCHYEGDLYVAKADSLWAIKGSTAEIVLDYRAFADDHNGRNICKQNVYLYFPVGYGLQRMYGLQIDNIGPDRDEGLPSGRQGPVDDMVPIPGLLFGAINAGASGTSSVLCYNEYGWHEMVRGDSQSPIRCLYLQVIPDGPNRLWFGMDNNACYINLPSTGLDPTKDTAVDYSESGEVVTSWVDLHLADVEKYFKTLKVVSEGLVASAQTITAYYQKDDAEDSDSWILIGTFDTSPTEEMSIGNTVTGRRIRFKFVLSTNSDSLTPKMLAWTMDALARIEPKSRWEPEIKLEDSARMLNGEPDPDTRAEKIAQLDTWAGSATPLTMTTVDPAYTNITTFIEPFVETYKAFESNPDHIVSKGRLVMVEA